MRTPSGSGGRVPGLVVPAVLLLLLDAVVPAAAQVAEEDLHRILAPGMDVAKLGRVSNPSVDDVTCLGADGTVVTAAARADRALGLVCIDGDGPRAIVRAGDPAPEYGVFSEFFACKVGPFGDVLFTAARRLAPDDWRVDYGIYRAGRSGIEAVIGIDETGHLGPSYLFAVNGLGKLVVSVAGSSELWLQEDRGFRHVMLEGPYEADHAIGSGPSDLAITDSGDVVLLASCGDDRRHCVFVLRDGELQLLAEEGDLGPAGTEYDFFRLVNSHDDVVVFSGHNRLERVSHYMLYDAQAAAVRPIAADDPVLLHGAPERIRRQLEASGEIDAPVLAFNQRGNVLLTLEDPGPLDLILVGPEAEAGGCPPNDWLSEAAPLLPTPPPTSTPIPTPTRMLVNPIELEVQTDSGAPGEQVEIRVLLHTKGRPVAGVQMDIGAGGAIQFAAQENGGEPCRVNRAIGKDHTRFRLAAEFGLRAIVFSVDDVDPIPDGSLLFTCQLDIAADAPPGTYNLRLTNMLGATPEGDPIDAVGRGGEVVVSDSGTRAREYQAVGPAAGRAGCQVSGRGRAGSALLLLLPVVLLAGCNVSRCRRPSPRVPVVEQT